MTEPIAEYGDSIVHTIDGKYTGETVIRSTWVIVDGHWLPQRIVTAVTPTDGDVDEDFDAPTVTNDSGPGNEYDEYSPENFRQYFAKAVGSDDPFDEYEVEDGEIRFKPAYLGDDFSKYVHEPDSLKFEDGWNVLDTDDIEAWFGEVR